MKIPGLALLLTLLPNTLFAATSAKTLFECKVTKVVVPSVLGSTLNTEDCSTVSGNEIDALAHIRLGETFFNEGENGFTIKLDDSDANLFTYTIEHTETGLRFLVHGNKTPDGTGTLAIKGHTDETELVFAEIKCETPSPAFK